jgi:hypothetical protein
MEMKFMDKRQPQQAPARGFNPMPEYVGDNSTDNAVMPPKQQRPQQQPPQRTIVAEPQAPRLAPQEMQEVIEQVATQYPQSVIDQEVMQERITQGIESAKTAKVDPLSKDPKSILAGLISRGYHTKDVEIFNQKWTLKALSQRDIMLAFNEVTDTNITRLGQTNALLFGQIVYAVEAVNGIPIYEWFPEIDRSKFSSTEAFQFAVRRAFLSYLEQMPNSIINAFINKYNEVEEERNKAVFELKNS